MACDTLTTHTIEAAKHIRPFSPLCFSASPFFRLHSGVTTPVCFELVQLSLAPVYATRSCSCTPLLPTTMAVPPAVAPGVPPTPTVIVGGGPVGLTVALHLVARGWKDVLVVERAEALIAADKNRTYAMGISHKGQEVLEGVMAAATRYRRDGNGVSNEGDGSGGSGSDCDGDTNGDARASAGPAKMDAFDVAPALHRRARESPKGLCFWTYNSWGKGVPSIRKRTPLPGRRATWIVRRQRLQEVLAAAAEAAGVTIRLATAVTGVTFGRADTDSATGGTEAPLPIAVQLTPVAGGGGQGETVRAGLLLGCDGCSSVVRAALAAAASVAGVHPVTAEEAVAGHDGGTGGSKADAPALGDWRWAFSTACRSPTGGSAAPAEKPTPPAASLTTGGVRVEAPAGFEATHYPYATQGWMFKAIPMPVGHPILGHPLPEGTPPPLPAVPIPATPPPDVVVAAGAGIVGATVRPRARQFSLVAFRTGDDDAGAPPLSLVLAPPGHDLWSVKSGPELQALFAENFPYVPGGGASLFKDEATASEVAAAPTGSLPRMVVPHSLVAALTPVTDGGGSAACAGGAAGLGGVVLLGDAAHPVPPDLGQGVNSGLTDVDAFVSALDCPAPPRGCAGGGQSLVLPPLHAALATYAAVRSAEAAALCGLSARMNGLTYNSAAPCDGLIGHLVGVARVAASFGRIRLQAATWKLSLGIVPPPAFISLVQGDSYASVLAKAEQFDRRKRWMGMVAGGVVAALLCRRLLA